MRTTIKDVARHLNISITTVSRALDGYADVSEETRQRVQQAAKDLGYVPNRAARQLRRQRTDTIGYILPADQPQFADPFFTEFIAGMGDEVSAHNYDLLVSTAPPNSSTEVDLYQRWVQGGKVDGMIINRIRLYDWRVQYLGHHSVPFVSLERSMDDYDFVGVETMSENGMNELIAHLVNLGHSRIAYIGGTADLKIEHDRFKGYESGLRSANISIDPALTVHGNLTPESGYEAAQQLFAVTQPPTAIVCVNDLTAIGALHAAHERGIRIGRDLSIAGFDGIADSAHTQPTLTTLDQPVYEIARRLVKMLLSLVREESMPERQIVIEPRLILRESTRS